MSSPAICARAVGVLLLLAGASALAQGDGTPRFAGRSLADSLRSLEAQGLALVFSDQLVRPDMKVQAEPTARRPREILDQLLAPHDLRAEEAPGGVLVIVAWRRPGHSAARPQAPPEAEPPSPPEPTFSEEIVVRSSRISLLDERPDSSLALGREEIERLPQLGGDLSRTLALLPGVAANDVTAQFSVRGGRRDEVKITLDGQELFDAYHLKDYDGALSLVPAQNLASATLSTGTYPVSQGDRMSGVLDLRTFEPTAKRRTALGLSVLDAQVRSAGRLPGESREGKGFWFVSGRRGAIDLAAQAIGDEHPSFWDLFAKAGGETPFGSLAGHLLAAGDGLRIDRVDGETSEALDNAYRSAQVWLTLLATPGDRTLIETSASWARIERDRRAATVDDDSRFSLLDRRDLRVLALAQTWSFDLGAPRHQPEGGWEARRYDTTFDYDKDLDLEFPVVAPFSTPRRTVHALRGTLSGDHLGVWASDRATFGRFTAELGGRLDRHTATGETLVSPRINLARRIGSCGVLRAGWGRFYQSQRPYELQAEDGETALRRAELSRQAVLGFEIEPPKNRAGLDGFRVELYRRNIDRPRPRFENLLEPLNVFQEIEPDRVRIAPERSRAQGLELLLHGKRGERFGWWLAYAYSRTEDRLSGASGEARKYVPRALDQPHSLTLDLNFRLPRSWNLNLAWKAHTGWPTTPVSGRFLPQPVVLHAADADEDDPDDPEEPEDPVPPEPEEIFTVEFGRLNSERLPTYHRLDLRASRSWERRGGRLTFFVDIQNLYDRQNLGGFDLQVDSDEGSIEVVKEHWPGIFPSLGITWEF